ncbi:MAG: polysaccharide export protein [Proteobacteria bacterium]|nr:polysaccharide export protein [Pseudomonadota bacterium]
MESPEGGVVFRAFIAALAVATLAGCGTTLDQGSHLTTASAAPVEGHRPQTERRPSSMSSDQADDIAKISAAPDPNGDAYKIGPVDVIDVSVFQVPELSKTVQVAADGTINLPLAGTILAAGKTSGEIEHDVAARLGRKYLQSPQVNVYVKEYNSQRVTIDGSVRRPGVYPLRGPMTLLQAIATAQGFTDTANSTVVIFRMENSARTAAQFNVDEIRAGKAKDPDVVQGDVVVVKNSTMKESYQALLKILPATSIFVSLL